MLKNERMIPLTKGQQSIWYMDQVDYKNTHYNIAAAITLSPKIVLENLEATFNILIKRHEALRSLVKVKDGKAYQHILASVKLQIIEHQADELSNDEIRTILREKSKVRFNLNRDIPLRVEIYQKNSHSIMYFCVHHMFSDFWSIALLIDEMSQIYTAISRSETPVLADIVMPFSEYCHASNKWLKSSNAEKAKHYWLEKLKSPVPELKLKTNKNDAISTLKNTPYRQGRHLKFTLNKHETSIIQRLVTQYKCTQFSVLLACYFKLLHRIYDEEDIIVGVPMLGRTKAKERLTVGYLVNPLPIYCQNVANKSIKQLAVQIHTDIRSMVAKQRYPLSEIAKNYIEQRALNTSPVFQTMFSYQQAQKTSSDWLAALTVEDESMTFKNHGLNIRSFAFEPEIAQFELSMVMALVDQQFSIDLQYDANMITPEHADAISCSFKEIIQHSENNTSTNKGVHTLISPPHQRPNHDINIASLIIKRIVENPDSIAIHQDNLMISYAELGHYCHTWMSLISDSTFAPNDNIAVVLEHGIEQISATLAIMFMGGFVAQIDIKSPPQRLQYCIDKCQAKIVISQQLDNSVNAKKIISTNDFRQRRESTETLSTSNNMGIDSKLVNIETGGALVFTSGSTGSPLCVVLSNENLSHFTQAAIEIYQLSADDVMLQFTSPGFDAYYEEVLPALAIGASLVPKPSTLNTDSEQFEQFIFAQSITIMSLPTAFWHVWVAQDSFGDHQYLAKLSRVIVGGERLSRQKVAIWNGKIAGSCQLFNTYGPSETTITATWHKVLNDEPEAVPIGFPMPGVQVQILNPQGCPQPAHSPGELYISGAGLSAGYFRDDEVSARRFVHIDKTPQKWFATGDQVSLDNNGQLHFIGRIGHQIKFHGIRVEPIEIERLIGEQVGISNAIVMLMDSKLVAFIESDQRREKSVYQRILSKYLIKEMIPTHYIHLPRFPTTSGGKVDRFILRENHQTQSSDPLVIAHSENDIFSDNLMMIDVLNSLFNQWLDVKIDQRLSFFEQGMDSLSAVAIAQNLSEHFSHKIPPSVLFENSNTLLLAKYLSQHIQPGDQVKLPDNNRENNSLCHRPERAGNTTPLTSAQIRILSLEKLTPDNHQTHQILCFRLTGQLDPLLFSQAWQAEINSHDALKLIFSQHEVKDQRVDSTIKHTVRYITELDGLNLDNKTQLAQQIFKDSAPFSFGSALLKISHGHYMFIVIGHPLLVDGTSFELLLSAFQDRYNRVTPNRREHLSRKSTSFIEYAHAQAKLASPVSYWSNYLQNCHSAPQLSLRKNHAKATLNHQHATIHLGNDLTQKLKAFTRDNGLTPASLLLTCYYLALAKYSDDEQRLVIGTAVSYRGYKAHQRMLGQLTNFSLVGPEIGVDNTFIKLAQSTQTSLMSAIEHQHIPLNELLALLPATNSGLSVECLYLYQPAPPKMFTLDDVTITNIDETKRPIPALLCLEVTAIDDDIELTLAFDDGIYALDGINCLMASIALILTQGLTQAEIHFNSLSAVPDTIQQLCDAEEVIWPEKQRLLHSLFTSTAMKHPFRTAIIADDCNISYGQLYRLSTRISRVIYDLRQHKSPLFVGILMDKGWEQVVSAIGVLRGGGTYAPINVSATEQQVNDLIGSTQISVIITSSLYKKLYNWPKHVNVLTLDEPIIRHSNVIPMLKNKVKISATDPAYIMFTSGTTGTPKGVVISHQAALNTIFAVNNKIKLNAKDRVFGLSNFNFDLSVYDVFGTFSRGAKLVLPDNEHLLEPAHWQALIVKHKVTIWNSVPALYRLMLDNMTTPYHGLRQVMLSGDWITLDLPTLSLTSFPSAALMSLGGATEVSIWSVSFDIVTVAAQWNSIPYGLPLANQSCYVLDNSLNVCLPGVAGELYIGGDGVALEYHNNPQATDEAFIFNPRLNKRLYKTGDAAKLSSKGYFEILGRLDTRIKIAGQFVDLSEVEHTLESIKQVTQSAVIGWKSANGSIRLAAFIVIAPAIDHPDMDNIHKHIVSLVQSSCATNLASHMVPSRLAILPTLPLTTNGKIDRASLEHYSGKFITVSTGGARPTTHIQTTLAEIWQDLLQCQDVRIADNFFELGGDSLLLVSMLAAIERKLNITLSIQTFLLYQTIQDIEPIVKAQLTNSTIGQANKTISNTLMAGELTEVLQQEIHLEQSIMVPPDMSLASTIPRHILLTGTTGYLGSRLLLALLQTTDAELYCLVRGTDTDTGFDRILEKITAIQPLTPQQEARIIPIKGDLAKPLLGLTQQLYNLLARKIDQIIHCGALVNFILPRSSLKKINVDGTVELLRLATRYKLKRFNYVSTVSVFPTIAKNLQKKFYENESINQPLPIVGGYPQSKWVAEKLIQIARERGVPINIFRPGVIFGDTRINDLPAEVMLVEFLKLCIDLKAVPALDILIDIAPVDFVASAIIHISQQSLNANYHLTNPEPVPLADFIGMLKRNGISLTTLPPQEWALLLVDIEKTRASEGLKTMVAMFKDTQDASAIIFGRNLQHFDCTNTLSALAETSIKCPKINERFIDLFHQALLD